MAAEKILRKLEVPNRAINYLQKERKERRDIGDEASIQQQMESGDIPIGFYDDLLWSKTTELLATLPAKMKEDRKRLEKLKNEVRAAQERLSQLGEERRQLTQNIASYQSQQKEIEEMLEPYESIIASDMQGFAQALVKLEEQATTTTRNQFNEDPNDFVALEDDSPNPKLSLIFNVFGVSKCTINKLKSVDGYEFFDSDLSRLCDEFHVEIGDMLQLSYIQSIAKSGNLLGGEHQKDCPVCNATTAKQLKYLIGEHADYNEDVRQLNTKLFTKLGINGPAFLGLKPQDAKEHLRITNKRSFLKAKRYFEQIHLEHINV